MMKNYCIHFVTRGSTANCCWLGLKVRGHLGPLLINLALSSALDEEAATIAAATDDVATFAATVANAGAFTKATTAATSTATDRHRR